MTDLPPEVFAFEVRVGGYDPVLVNHVSAGRAKAQIWRESGDVLGDRYRFIDLRCRKLGPPQSTPRLAFVLENRRRPELVAGALVRVRGEKLGRIVDGASRACFAVQVDAVTRVYAHPAELELVSPATASRASPTSITAADLQRFATAPAPTFADPEVQAVIAAQAVTGRAFSAALADAMEGRDRGMSVGDYLREAAQSNSRCYLLDSE